MNAWTKGIGLFCTVTALAAASPPPHEQPPTMPWIKPLREMTQQMRDFTHPCASHATRDGYTSIQVNVDAYGCNIPGDAANEPSIAIDPTDPKKIVIGWRQFDSVLSDFRQAGWAYSHDAGHTWVFQGPITPGVFGSDPVLMSDAGGVIHYVSINFDEGRLFRSFDGGMTWGPKQQFADSFYDKPWLAIDKTNGPGRGNLYITSGTFSVPLRSTDHGYTFSPLPGQGAAGFTNVVSSDGCLWTAGGMSNSPYINVGLSCDVQNAGAIPSFVFQRFSFAEDSGGCSNIPTQIKAQTWIEI